MRLDRLLVQRGFGSRREVAVLLRRGVVRVGTVAVRDPRHAMAEDDTFWVEGVVSEPPPRLVGWHKPVGVLTTVRDPWGREGLEHALPANLSSLHPVGRLDRETSGLLLMSSDGQLTQRLLHPKRGVPRTYVATVDGPPGPELVERLREGVQTAEGVHSAVVESIEGVRVRLTVTEGKHRMVRRMLHNAGSSVLELQRVAYGPWSLDGMEEGAWRVLDATALEGVHQL